MDVAPQYAAGSGTSAPSATSVPEAKESRYSKKSKARKKKDMKAGKAGTELQLLHEISGYVPNDSVLHS